MYHLRTDTFQGISITSAYTNDGDHYIGDQKFAEMLTQRGIVPELNKPDHKVCSIGFCEKEQKWYGWSHRAMFGFGIGSEVKKDDCAYVPKDEADCIDHQLRFWGNDEFHASTSAVHHERDGVRGVLVEWKYNDTVPNEDLRGNVSSIFQPYPEFGRGAWIAKTLDDARQMASDFAAGVS